MNFREHLAELMRDPEFVKAWEKVTRTERIRSKKNIENARSLGYCQICGSRKNLSVHHIRTRGAGGGDELENLVLLCAYHHRLVQDHIINLDECELLSTRVPDYEELLQRAVDCVQAGDESRWTLGAICAILTNVLQVKRGDLASTLGCSSRYISELVRVWSAFPAETMRVPELSWQHHRIAAKTNDPAGWLARAHEQGWSTREMEAAIKAEAQGQKGEDEAIMERARRAFNLVRSVFESDVEPAINWLYRELRDAYFPAEEME